MTDQGRLKQTEMSTHREALVSWQLLSLGRGIKVTITLGIATQKERGTFEPWCPCSSRRRPHRADCGVYTLLGGVSKVAAALLGSRSSPNLSGRWQVAAAAPSSS